MNILIDAQAFDIQGIGGVSKCWVNIIESILKNKNTNIHVFLSAKGTNNWHLQNSKLSKNISKENNDWKEENKQYTIKLLQSGKYDIFIPTHYDTYFLPYLGNTKLILLIHDLIGDIYENYLNKSLYYYDRTHYTDEDSPKRKLLCDKAIKIIAISNVTKNDIIKYYGVSKDKIEIIYHGSPKINQKYSNLLGSPYILYVGTRLGFSNYKCFIPFVNQISLFIKNHPNFKLVFTHTPFFNIERELIHQYGLDNNIINYYATDEELNNLYHYAFCFVFPSEYEGFGMPMLEAAENKCVVLYNKNNPTLNEISNHSFIGYDGQYITDLNDKLEWLYNYGNKEKITNNQLMQCKNFNWDDNAKKYINVFNEILNQ